MLNIDWIRSHLWMLRKALAGAALGIGLTSLIGFMTNKIILAQWHSDSVSMALPTSIAIILLSLVELLLPALKTSLFQRVENTIILALVMGSIFLITAQ